MENMRLQLIAFVLAAALVVPAAGFASPNPPEVTKALGYLRGIQKLDGSVGSGASSAWSAIAFARAGVDPGTVRVVGGASLRDFVVASTHPVNHDPLRLGASLLSEERQVLGMVASGVDPRSAPGYDAVADMVSAYDGTQLGDIALLNDDIFGLLALHAAGVPNDNAVIQNVRAFVLQNQQPSGAFGFGSYLPVNSNEAFSLLFADLDDTGQAMVALLATGSSPTDVPILRAEGFIKLGQGLDGGCGGTLVALNAAENVAFGALFSGQVPTAQSALTSNADSSSWGAMGLLAAGQDLTGTLWTMPVDQNIPSFLRSLQAPDGHFDWEPGNPGFSVESTTAYATLVLEGHTFVG